MSGMKQVQLLNAVAIATGEDKIVWEVSPDSPDAYRAKIGSKWVVITRKESSEDSDPDTFDYELLLLDSTGRLIDSFIDTELFERFDEHFRREGIRPYKIMRDIYISARRYVSGADTAIDEVIKELDNDIPF